MPQPPLSTSNHDCPCEGDRESTGKDQQDEPQQQRNQQPHRQSITQTPKRSNANVKECGGDIPSGAAGLMCLFAAPPLDHSTSERRVADIDKSQVGTNGKSSAAPRPGPAPLLPSWAMGSHLERQRTDVISNVSASASSSSRSMRGESRQSDGSQTDHSIAARSRTEQSSALEPVSKHRRGLDQSDPNEGQALLSAHGNLNKQRYVSPATSLNTLHDMFRPPPSVHSTGASTAYSRSDSTTSSHRYLPTKKVQLSMTAAGAKEHAENRRAGEAARYLRRARSSVVKSIQQKSCSWSARNVSSLMIGSFTFVLFQIVFCLAESSAVAGARYGAKQSILGPMMKAAALGGIVQVPIFVCFLSADLPSLYPCVDLFLAPFMSQIALSVHSSLEAQGIGDDIETFLATFFLLNAIGLAVTAIGNFAASQFKLANLGSFLPYSVICGFFSYVGLTLWMLAIAVDTGSTWDKLFFSGDLHMIKTGLKHHGPAVLVGFLMFFLGPKYPSLTPLAVLSTIAMGYILMFVTGTTFEEAQSEGWFYGRNDFIYEAQDTRVGFISWSPPAPFGIIPSIFTGAINVQALSSALPQAFGMASIYLLRCSLHAAALRKSTTAMLRSKHNEPPPLPSQMGSPSMKGRGRSVSDASHMETLNNTKSTGGDKTDKIPTSMNVIIFWYGLCLLVGGIVGGVAVLPGVAVGATLYKLGAGGITPQHGGTFLLLIFYISNFALVRYIPKPAFTCLLIMCSLDMMLSWFVDSFKKTKSVYEWMTCPSIVLFSFLFGQLTAVALGIALSTFIFVAHINRSGVVKFLANGLTIRSPIERSAVDAEFLDQNGDLIQMIVLQNYLFFGNANSIDQYIGTMFEEISADDASKLPFSLPPVPKYLILDFAIVTGIDTSAVDVFSDIISVCKFNDCHVIFSGLSPNLKSIFAHAGVRPTRGLRFLPDIEAALGKAEDALIKYVFNKEEKSRREAGERKRTRLMSFDDDGFRFALKQIDEQHNISFASDLAALEKHTKALELQPGQNLFGEGNYDDSGRGLFFIETGYMKVERDPTYTMTRGSQASLRRKVGPSFGNQRIAQEGGSISQLKARTPTIGREAALLKAATGHSARTSHTFRLGRFGPGWVVGTIEGTCGLRNPGLHIAITECRLHHLPFTSLQELEVSNPSVVLRLFKMMSHIMSRRQELTIEQLSTLHSIMTSPASQKPVSRATMGAIQNAMIYSNQ